MAEEDYYALLGVKPQRHRGRDQARLPQARPRAPPRPPRRRPGRRRHNEERFKLVNRAYETLKDPERRRQYDMFGAGGRARRATRSPGSPAAAGRHFRRLLRRRRRAVRRARAATAAQRPAAGARTSKPLLDLEFAEAVLGAEKEVTVRAATTCETCSGTGCAPRDHGGDLHDLQRAGRAAPGAPVPARPDGHLEPLPPLRRDRRGDPHAVPRLPGPGPAHGGPLLHRRRPRRRRRRLHPAPLRPGLERAPRRAARRPLPAPAGAAPPHSSAATASTCARTCM